MKYDTYRYLYPPRPERAVAPNTLQVFESQGWWAQAKMNGTCTTLYVPPALPVHNASFAMGRHGPDNKLVWQPRERWNHFQEYLPGKGWYVFAGELLHSKGVGVRDTMYLFDILVDDGEYLIGKTYQERYQRLARLCFDLPYDRVEEHTHTIVAPGVWLANYHGHSFSEWYGEISNMPGKPPIEGLVFKSPTAKLLPCGTASANSKWQQKCRKTTDHLSF